MPVFDKAYYEYCISKLSDKVITLCLEAAKACREVAEIEQRNDELIVTNNTLANCLGDAEIKIAELEAEIKHWKINHGRLRKAFRNYRKKTPEIWVIANDTIDQLTAERDALLKKVGSMYLFGGKHAVYGESDAIEAITAIHEERDALQAKLDEVMETNRFLNHKLSECINSLNKLPNSKLKIANLGE